MDSWSVAARYRRKAPLIPLGNFKCRLYPNLKERGLRRKYPKYVNRAVTRHGKVIFYFRRGNGPRHRLPDPNSEEFQAAYEAALDGVPAPIKKQPRTKAIENKHRVGESLKTCFASARQRAAKRGLEFSITLDLLLDKAEASNCCCELTGIPFFSTKYGATHTRAFSPSIDRIDPRYGYVPENIRIVIFSINAMLNNWGEPVFRAVAHAYRTKRRQDMMQRH